MSNETCFSTVDRFFQAPLDALFKQTEIMEILPYSSAWFERMRWSGNGIRFLKLGHKIFYRKADVLDFINKNKPFSSTAEYSASINGE